MNRISHCVLVDDDSVFRSFARTCLQQMFADLEVIEFTDGFEALDYLSVRRTELVVTDFRMPGMDGLRLVEAVRSFDPEIPILMISGEAIGDEALERGADAFLPKHNLLTGLGSALEQIGIHRRGGTKRHEIGA